MSMQGLRKEAHDLDTTIWMDRSGIESMVGEFNDQLVGRSLVKARFLQAAFGGTTVDEAVTDLAERMSTDLIEIRGRIVVYHR